MFSIFCSSVGCGTVLHSLSTLLLPKEILALKTVKVRYFIPSPYFTLARGQEPCGLTT